MSLATPRIGLRLSHTPKMSERKRALFQSEQRLNSCKRNLADDMKEDSDDSCDLGIISALDSSSSPERYDQSVPQTPNTWRSQTRRSQRIIKPNLKYAQDIIKSPLTFRNYSSRSKPLEMSSAPTTPCVSGNFGSPLSAGKYTLGSMSQSGKPRARKSLTSLIADTESCSSSLKDLTFDSDSGADSKENTPSKGQTKLSRRLGAKRDSVSNYGSGPESDFSKKTNSSPLKSINSDYFSSPKSAKSCHFLLSKTQSPSVLKTPHIGQVLADETVSPPKLHNRKFVLEIIEESPMNAKINEKGFKRIRDSHNDSRDYSPQTKQMKLETAVPKARLSLFNEFLSAKCFYPKSNVDPNASFATGVSHAIRSKYKSHGRRTYSSRSNKRSKRVYGEINMGVRHKIRKPKQSRIVNKLKPYVPVFKPVKSATSADGQTTKDLSRNKDAGTLEAEKCDPFETEHQTIETLLNQWTEEDVPANEPQVQFTNERLRHEIRTAESLVHHTTLSQAILHLEPLPNPTILQTVATPSKDSESSMDGYEIRQIGDERQSEFLPVDGGFLLVNDTVSDLSSKPTNLEEIESEIRFLDDQIAKMAKINNINAELLLSPTSQMCDMASGLVLTSPKILNGIGATDASVVNYDYSNGDDVRLIYTSGNSNDGTPAEPVTASPAQEENRAGEKLFPVFTKTALSGCAVSMKGAPKTPKTSRKTMATHRDQYIIDAGQKKIGATQCSECGVIYSIGDPQDEMDHLMHHNAVDVLRFPGWKDEFVCGVWGTARCVRVRGSESGVNGARWRRVLKLLERVVHPQLGYANQLPSNAAQEYSAYLYIDNKQIIGCLIAEIKMKGNKFLPGLVYCCSREEYPVKCGISRLWTHISHRRRGVATHLVNAMRANFLYGQILNAGDLAFSAPTPAGRAFAEAYTGTENFYVYVN